ncbi:MAG: HupU protein [Magnetovibrio sp.]|nr:HupU protein [Magnetovibrio sp.]
MTDAISVKRKAVLAGKPFNILWLQAGSCGGCTMSVLEAGSRNLFDELQVLGAHLLWHPALSEATGRDVQDLLNDIINGDVYLDALCIEGAVMTGPKGSGKFQMVAGLGKPMAEVIRDLAARARYVVGIGTCATYGGIPAAGGSIGEATGLQYLDDSIGGLLGADFVSSEGLPVINISGCAPHPGWIMETISVLTYGDFSAEDLDALGRPRFISNHLAHHGCDRNEFYEFKASAATLSDRGCLMENLGCKATQASGDCNLRAWNGEGSCTKGGFSCIACTAPAFQNIRNYHETPKVAGIPVGLPVDMPKAWFVALAALSKSATPERVRRNAHADHVVVPPGRVPGPRSDKGDKS